MRRMRRELICSTYVVKGNRIRMVYISISIVIDIRRILRGEFKGRRKHPIDNLIIDNQNE